MIVRVSFEVKVKGEHKNFAFLFVLALRIIAKIIQER